VAKVLNTREEVIPKLREVFRENGFEGTSLSTITQLTGIGKSSLYHHFPDGKEEMAAIILDDIDQWFEVNIFIPLRDNENSVCGIKQMFKQVNRYFNSGNRICLIGAFALDNTRDLFPKMIKDYFKAWIDALTISLNRTSLSKIEAITVAEDTVISIQGALVLARSQNDSKYFTKTLKRLEQRIVEFAND